ncbi:unnamed protein product (macronuclear) [Paramecium tetraurelia]|uniref:Protein kinase domain-containing protein n=1 Tax=Paramecium tetraurelia TaxID=5888 RepID=A0CRM8_PARTE|nr:uncharacterized protein GSPATT00009760001 [Paramecium tetraurelia]CAK73445.1 unnamed protein product [Paramecium tetraurelia]|eukprot:XP_001440842.1 hypothetical protein (macronuclear) [Paramecium tetraurelia strain d4-2]
MNIQYSFLPNYQFQRIIGHGTFGYVFEAYDRTNDKKVAIKRIQKISKQLSREYEILLLLKGSPNIIQIEDIYLSQTDEGINVQNIIFEYKDFSLENILAQAIRNRQFLQPNQIKSLMRQIIIGLCSLSAKDVVHRDLKPENILVDKDGNLVLCDFGSAKVIDQRGMNTSYVVSQYYRAPELILSHTNYGAEIDIWAAGCIFSEMMDLKVLFEGKNEGDQLYCIFQTLGSLKDIEMIYLFQHQSYNQEIQKRFKGYEQKDMKFWLNKFSHIPNNELAIDLLLKMLQINPRRRITAKEALQHPYFQA